MRDSLESAALANCELAGTEIWLLNFAGTTCPNTGNGEVTTNLVHTGACWEDEDHEDGKFCPLTGQCGRLYDCSDDPVLDGGETGGELGWGCDQF